MKNVVDQIAGLIIEANKVAVFTGAGVSTESGISDFRSPDGIWSRYDPEDFTIQRFVAYKEARKRNWQLRRELVSANYQPNPAHHAIAELEKLGKLACVITQNIDGLHHAIIENGIVQLQMVDVDAIEKQNNHVFLNTGSPHHVQFENDIQAFDIKTEGAKIRYRAPYNEEGTNVNFVKKLTEDTFRVRTYERGVEDETLSCGTGVTAVAIAMHAIGNTGSKLVNLDVEGGKLKVSFDENNGVYSNVWLIGPAEFVFEGTI